MTLSSWKPTFAVAGTGPNNLSYTINYVMTARAIAAPRDRIGTEDMLTPWSKPSEDTFFCQFDGGDCTTGWAVSGSYTSGQFKYDYSGGGAKTMHFTQTDGTLTHSDFHRTHADATTVDISIGADVEMTYTETISWSAISPTPAFSTNTFRQ